MGKVASRYGKIDGLFTAPVSSGTAVKPNDPGRFLHGHDVKFLGLGIYSRLRRGPV